MATIHHSPKNPPCYKVSHFTPRLRPLWRWIITVPIITLSEDQPTITGEIINIGNGTTMWSGLPGAPSFATRAEAVRWAQLMQLPNLSIESE